MATTGHPPQGSRGKGHSKKHKLYPMIWFGCDFTSWMKLLREGSLAVDPFWLPAAFAISGISLFNSLWRYQQEIQYGSCVAGTEIEMHPLFIIGHWRTGTTFLHELLALDQRHTYPTTYECMSPNHFLISESHLCRWLNFLLPSRRPMDNMNLHWQSPQEDEFALCNMGQPSPYLMFAFPNHVRRFEKYFCLDGWSGEEVERWKQALMRFIRQITYKSRKRVILKSPPHTFRIKWILDLFPNALFVHMVRNPYVVIPSTLNMLKSLCRVQCLHHPTFEGFEDFVLDTFERMQNKFEEGKRRIAPSAFCEIRYEDLVRDPVGEMRRIYEHLGLGGFEAVLPALVSHLAGYADYKTNRYDLSDELRTKIRSRCGGFMEKYGYEE